jgi:taurine dioxygenase
MWQVKELSGHIGAEVTGLSLNNVSTGDIDKIKKLLHEHLVLFFPEQGLDQKSHVSLGQHFGELEGHPNLGVPYPDHPEIFELIATTGGVADEWHTDITFQNKPAKMSILNMMKTPKVGGDTMWSSLYAAYDELSEPMKALCENLTALHDALPHNKPEIMAVHPVVRIHPVTKRKALFVNEHFTRRIVELNASESNALLPFLTNWVSNPRFTVRYSWTKGTICMWDNRCTQHFVLNDFSGERIIQRVTIMGDEVEGCNEQKWEPWVRPGRLSATSRHDRQLYLYMNAKAEKPLA